MNELVVIALIAGRRVAIDAARVASVIDIEETVPVPRAPDHVLGLASLRSQVLTVIDSARAIGASDATSVQENARAIVIEADGHGYAFLVDDVSDVVAAIGEPEAVPGTSGPGWADASLGLLETESGPALLIDPLALLMPKRKAAA